MKIFSFNLKCLRSNHAEFWYYIVFVDIPQEVDKYHNLFPLEPPPANPLHKSSTFGYPTTCYRATNTKDGLPYCLRRIHGTRYVYFSSRDLSTLCSKCMYGVCAELNLPFPPSSSVGRLLKIPTLGKCCMKLSGNFVMTI